MLDLSFDAGSTYPKSYPSIQAATRPSPHEWVSHACQNVTPAVAKISIPHIFDTGYVAGSLRATPNPMSEFCTSDSFAAHARSTIHFLSSASSAKYRPSKKLSAMGRTQRFTLPPKLEVPRVADNDILIASFDEMKASCFGLFDQVFQGRVLFNVRDFAANDTAILDSLCIKDSVYELVWTHDSPPFVLPGMR